jgi:hypothetical protein
MFRRLIPRVAGLERKVGQQALEINFFKEALRRTSRSHPGRAAGTLSIERICALGRQPRQQLTGTGARWLRAASKRSFAMCCNDWSVAHHLYGNPGSTLLLRKGWAVNHRRMLRLMRTDNLLYLRQSPSCRRPRTPAMTGTSWRTLRGVGVTGLDELRVARHHLPTAARGIGVPACRAERVRSCGLGWANSSSSPPPRVELLGAHKTPGVWSFP